MNFQLPPLSTIIAALSGLGGVLGVILTACGVGDLTKPATAVVGAVSVLLTAIAGHHATSVVASKAKSAQPFSEGAP